MESLGAGMAEFAEAFEASDDDDDDENEYSYDDVVEGNKNKKNGRRHVGITTTTAAAAAAPASTASTSSKAAASSVAQNTIRAKSAGGFYDATFLRAVAPLYDMHMGRTRDFTRQRARVIFVITVENKHRVIVRKHVFCNFDTIFIE